MDEQDLKGDVAFNLLLKALKIMNWGMLIPADLDENDTVHGFVIGDEAFLVEAEEELGLDRPMEIYTCKEELDG